MSRSIFLFTILALTCATVTAQLKKDQFLKPQPITIQKRDTWHSPTMRIASTGTCIGGMIADAATSGPNELNSFVRRSDGSANKGKIVAIGIAPCVASLAVEHFWPKTAKGMNLMRFIVGGVHLGVGLHNRFGVTQ